MESSKITSKGQTTIPAIIRNALNLSSGDELLFELDGDRVILKKALPIDLHYLKALEVTFSEEWDSQADCEAFDDL